MNLKRKASHNSFFELLERDNLTICLKLKMETQITKIATIILFSLLIQDYSL